jgi:hypothetical protein
MLNTWKKLYEPILKCGYGVTAGGNTVSSQNIQTTGLKNTYLLSRTEVKV